MSTNKAARRRLIGVILTTALLVSGCATTNQSPPPDQARFEQGKAAYVHKDYAKAFELMLGAAQSGNAHAQYTVGYMYYEGQGVSKNRDQALKWIRESAKNGDRRAVEALSRMAGMAASADKKAERGSPAKPEPAQDN